MICTMVILVHIWAINPQGEPEILRFSNVSYEAVVDGVPTPYYDGLDIRGWGVDHTGWEYENGVLWVGGIVAPKPDQLRINNKDRRHDRLDAWDFENAKIEVLWASGNPRLLPPEYFQPYWTGTVLRVEIDDWVALYPDPVTALYDTDVHGPSAVMEGMGGENEIPPGLAVRIDYEPDLALGAEFTLQFRVRSDVESATYRLGDQLGAGHPWRFMRHTDGRCYLWVGHDVGGEIQYLNMASAVIGDGEPVWLTFVVDRAGSQKVWTNRELSESQSVVLGPAPASTSPIYLHGGSTTSSYYSTFRLFDQALDDDEVAATVGTPLAKDDWQSLVVDLGFDAVSGTIVTDQTDNAHDGHAEGFTITAGSTYTGTHDQHGKVMPVALGRIFGAPIPPIDPRMDLYRVGATAVKDVQFISDGGARRAPDQSEQGTLDFDPATRVLRFAQGGGGLVTGSRLHRWVRGGEIEITGYNAGTVQVEEIIPSPYTAHWPAGHRIRVTDATGWTAGQGLATITGLNPGWQNLAGADGVIALTSRAVGTITADLIGDARIATEPPGPGITPMAQHAGNVAALLATAYGPRLAGDDFTVPAFGEFPQSVGLWLSEPTTTSKPLEQVLRAAQAAIVVDDDGVMRMQRFLDPDVDPSPPVMTLGPRLIAEIHRVKRPPVPDGLYVGYARNHSEMEADQIAEGIDPDTRAFLAEKFRWVESPQGASPRLGVETPRVETVLALQGDAQALADETYERTRTGRLYRIILAEYLDEYHQKLRWGNKITIDPSWDPIDSEKLRFFDAAAVVTIVGHKGYPGDNRYEIVVLRKGESP